MNWSNLLTKHEPRVDKDGPLWSPVRYGETKHRRGANYRRRLIIVFDFGTGVSPARHSRRRGVPTPPSSAPVQQRAERPSGGPCFHLAEGVLAKDWREFYKQAVVVLRASVPQILNAPRGIRCSTLPPIPSARRRLRSQRVSRGRLLSAAELPVPTPEAPFTTRRRSGRSCHRGSRATFAPKVLSVSSLKSASQALYQPRRASTPFSASGTRSSNDPICNPNKTDTVIWQGADGVVFIPCSCSLPRA